MQLEAPKLEKVIQQSEGEEIFEGDALKECDNIDYSKNGWGSCEYCSENQVKSDIESTV